MTTGPLATGVDSSGDSWAGRPRAGCGRRFFFLATTSIFARGPGRPGEGGPTSVLWVIEDHYGSFSPKEGLSYRDALQRPDLAEPLRVAFAEGGERLARGQVEVRGDLEQRDQHERALGQLRVRDGEAVLVDGLVAVEQQVQVDFPRPPAFPVLPAQLCFDRLQLLQQLAGAEGGAHLGGGVQVVGLRGAQGRRLVHRRDGGGGQVVGDKGVDRGPEEALPVA